MKPSFKIILSLTLGNALFPALFSRAHAEALHGPHEHGTVEIVREDAEGFLGFTVLVPAVDLFGFEHLPQIQAERDKVLETENKLFEEDSMRQLFIFEPLGSCVPYQTNILSDILDHIDETADAEKPAESGKADTASKEKSSVEHTDVLINYQFDCGPVKRLSLGFADEFPSIQRYRLRKKTIDGGIEQEFSADKAVLDIDWSPQAESTGTGENTK